MQLDRWAERHELKVSASVALAAMTLWSRLHGLVSLEIEGNFASMDLDPATLYDTEVADVVAMLQDLADKGFLTEVREKTSSEKTP